MTQSILLLGAGELGMAVLEALAKHPRRGSDTKLAVLLRQSTIDSTDHASPLKSLLRIFD